MAVFKISDAFAAKQKCSSGRYYNAKRLPCQGLQRHPFQTKDIVESLAAGAAED